MNCWKTENLDDGVVLARYSAPPMNYFCAQGATELGELIAQWQSPEVRAVILTGDVQGKFITHYSVEELLSYAEDRESMCAIGTTLTTGYHAMLLALRDLPKPVIAALNGDAMGGGFELSLACDLRIAADVDARFGLPEVKLGILPGGSGTQRLSRLIGAGRAVEFILRGRVVPPADALALGLVHEVVPDALVRARELASEMVRSPPLALAKAKHAVWHGSDVPLAAGLHIESSDFLETMLSKDAVAAMRAYVSVPLEERRNWLEAL